MTQLRLVEYVGDSDMTDEDLTPVTPLNHPSTLSPTLQNSHISTEVQSTPAPVGVDMMGLSGTKPLRTSNSAEPTESLSLSQVVSAPEVNPPSLPKHNKSGKKRIVSYYDLELSDSDEYLDNSNLSDSNTNSAIQRETPVSVDDLSPLPINGSSTGTDSPAETPRKGVLYSVMFPQDPLGRCSNSLQDKVMRALEKNLCFNKAVEQDKNFRNPSIYEKMIEFCGIDEYGTNYPTHLFDPSLWRESGGYENLRRLQKEAYDRKQKARVEAAGRARIEFVSGKRSAQDEVNGNKKKSKWDLSPNN
ncbi:hypothetical protein LOD99_337 [Oopsacas minuta]|uniref:SAP30-binding protein n=1 Tax=Oopsacas minuta TaxID=111878 RepID=A0AAV7KAC3_9METZ|nr:hypothetical protein LOD99_337 [Oopsacas minuta]